MSCVLFAARACETDQSGEGLEARVAFYKRGRECQRIVEM